jgi:hypothetical protein
MISRRLSVVASRLGRIRPTQPRSISSTASTERTPGTSGTLGTLVAALLITAAAPASPLAQALTLTPEQQREFLRTAKVVASRPIGKGITGSLRLTLSDGTFTHDAGFQSVDDRASDEDRRQMRKRAGEINFVDSYKYNIAAYEIARVLGLDHMMPVTVARRYQGRNGSLTWWVDNVLMDEAEREKSPHQPPSPLDFSRQRMRMVVFAELVGDVDRNKGNVLYTKDWRVIMIDFTRAFRLHRTLRQPGTLLTLDRALWERLQKLDRDAIRRAADEYLTLEETAAIVFRQRALVEHYTELIKKRGEGAVLY